MPSEDLHRPLESIDRGIGKVRDHLERVRGEIEKLREAVEEGFASIRDAIHENIRAQAELQLIDYMTDVKMKKVQIDAEVDQIEEEKAELDAQLETISERYAEKHAELNEKAAERIRELGSHIFEIEEAEFEAGIHDPYVEHVSSVWRELERHSSQVYSDRQNELQQAVAAFTHAVRDFLEGQAALIDRIDEHKTDLEVAGDEVEEFQLPYYVIHYVEDGEEKSAVVGPSRVEETAGGWCSAGLEPLAGTQDIVERLAADDRNTEVTDHLTAQEVGQQLDAYGDSSLVTSYAAAVQTTMPGDSVPVAKETTPKEEAD